MSLIAARIVPNVYRDSVALMQLSARIADGKGIEQASVVMATPANLELLAAGGLTPDASGARASDILIVVRAKSMPLAEAALAAAESGLRGSQAADSKADVGSVHARLPRSIMAAKAAAPDANLALISVPGEYAAAEARKALDAGLHVMLFSDNVSIEDEQALKQRARSAKRIVMGPDCGTAIIDGVPLGFANVVRRGAIGCIGASGTGLQQVTTLIDRAGEGISQAIGTGGRDLHADVGGLSTLAALDLLSRDAQTAVIVLISKPPAPAVAKKVLTAAAKLKKPVVVNFIGADPKSITAFGGRLYAASTLDAAANAAVDLVQGRVPRARRAKPQAIRIPRFSSTQRHLRGLYSGGTFCYEALLGLERALGPVHSNIAERTDVRLDDPWRSRGHTVVDLGDDVFTRGRPHPMIDHRLRNERLVAEARDPSVAVILFDLVLGHGAHPDPANAMLPAIGAAKSVAAKAKRPLALVGFVCGTAADPQSLTRQETTLREAGVLVGRSHAEAMSIALALLKPINRGRR